jgi:dTDP-4-dehydrorhamnose 3,5-epimerase
VDEAWETTGISGVLRRSAPRFEDERGAFIELWRASLTDPLGADRMVQGNVSRSRAGVLRGMHFHLRQADVWVLLEGKAVAATTDLRRLFSAPDTTPRSQVLHLEPGDVLYLPRLVAHGFWAIEPTMLVYFVSNEYDGSDEHGFAWNDVIADIEWPSGEPILSDRDRTNPRLVDAMATLRASG